MQFTDAVTFPGTPPVAPAHLDACKRAIGRFALENGIPTPVGVSWREREDSIELVGEHNGRAFGIAAPKG